MQSYLGLWPSNQGAYANTTACVQIMYRFVSQLIIPHIEFHNICLKAFCFLYRPGAVLWLAQDQMASWVRSGTRRTKNVEARFVVYKERPVTRYNVPFQHQMMPFVTAKALAWVMVTVGRDQSNHWEINETFVKGLIACKKANNRKAT